MRALAAVVTLAACSSLYAHESLESFPRALLTALGATDRSPAHRLLDCTQVLGFTKCVSALSVWRSQRAIENLQTGRAVQFDLREDVEQFPWDEYGNSTEDQLYTQLTKGTEELLRYRSLRLSLPGYSFELESKGNGTLNVDILKNDDTSTSRGMMKKYLKDFYNIVPFLMVPGLIMSAILPFILPMLKMMTVAVGMLNNMALSGAVFTLLRNNAFSDHYEKKVIYVNEGYKNEKFSPVYGFKGLPFKDLPFDTIDMDYHASGSELHPAVQPMPQSVSPSPTAQSAQGNAAAATDNFNLAPATDNFNMAGVTDNFNLAGAAENFNLAGATENFNLAGGKDNFNLAPEHQANLNWIQQYYGNPNNNAFKVRRSSKTKVNQRV